MTPANAGQAQQPPHPQRCEMCENKECEYWEVHPHMSARHDHDTGWTASPGVITFSKGCASHTESDKAQQPPHPQRCETCDNFDKFYSSCTLLFYETSIGGKKETVHPLIGHRDDWMIKTLGCASHSSAPAQQNPLAKENLTVGMVYAYEAGQDEAQQRIEQVIEELEAMRDRNDKKGNPTNLNFNDGVAYGCERAITLLQAGDRK